MHTTSTERRHAEIATPLGRMTLAATPRGLAGAWFVGQRHYPATEALGRRDDHHPTLQRAAQQLQAFLAGTRRHFDVPLDLDAGTPFQQSVWRALLQIPVGTTCSYAAIAAAIGKPAAVRAVGAAVGRNPVSIIVPCHRVVGSQGALTGYAGGLPRKAQLLALEAAAVAGAAAPDPERRRAIGPAARRSPIAA